MSGEANAYVAQLRAENARLREVVRRVEGLAAELDRPIAGITFGGIPQRALFSGGDVCYRLRAALSGPTPAEPSTDTGPAPAGAHAATQGAGDGV